ncbi:MAG: FKBP-type peptidyl-prolyl cis-trans isomerase [Candidatus Bathyarchaeota archaeon]
MPVKKGDFIVVDYVTKIKETGETFDTTLAEEAKRGEVFKENTTYEPMFVVVGESWVLKKLDDSLVGLNVDENATIEILPENGFGLRDSGKIKIIPINKFRKQDIKPYPGAQIEIDGKTAVVRSVGAGRVQVDFNSPLAGKTLVYDLTVKKIIDDKLEKIKALIHRRIPSVSIDKFNLNVTEKKITIELPEEAIYLEGIQFAKRGAASDLQNFFSPERIIFTEVFAKPSQPPAEESTKQVAGSTDIEPQPVL